MKARIERERIPPSDDPQFHLKLGRGSLSDVEWTVQLLQLRTATRGPGTLNALDHLERAGALGTADAASLREAYRFCVRTRNRWHLVGNYLAGAGGVVGAARTPCHASRSSSPGSRGASARPRASCASRTGG